MRRMKNGKTKKILSMMLIMVFMVSIFAPAALAAEKPSGSGSSSDTADYETMLSDIQNQQSSSDDDGIDSPILNGQDLPDSADDLAVSSETSISAQYVYEVESNNDFYLADVISDSYAGVPNYVAIGQINDYYYDVDIYQFTLTSPGTLSLIGFWLDDYYGYTWEEELLIGLYNSSQQIIAAANYYQTSSKSGARMLDIYLSAGTYYIMVLQDDNYHYLFVDDPYAICMGFEPATTSVSYQSHVQDIGWQSWKSNGGMSGTSGQSLRLEAMRISVDDADGGIEYRTHVQNYGWMDWVSDGDLSGTSGQSLRLEAIQIRLTGAIASQYDVYYRVHAQNIGWMGWAKNGESAGTAGYSYRLEAIQIKLVPKGGAAPGSTANSFSTPVIAYQSHVQNIGWQDYAFDGATSGTSGQSLRLEAMRIRLVNIAGGIEYKTHVQNIGWMDWVSNDALSGTSGQSLRLEAIQIRLTGEAANLYDVYYRVHAQNFGWMGWAKNGESAGTAGYSYRLEAIQIQLVPKGGAAPGSTYNCFIQK